MGFAYDPRSSAGTADRGVSIPFSRAASRSGEFSFEDSKSSQFRERMTMSNSSSFPSQKGELKMNDLFYEPSHTRHRSSVDGVESRYAERRSDSRCIEHDSSRASVNHFATNRGFYSNYDPVKNELEIHTNSNNVSNLTNIFTDQGNTRKQYINDNSVTLPNRYRKNGTFSFQSADNILRGAASRRGSFHEYRGCTDTRQHEFDTENSGNNYAQMNSRIDARMSGVRSTGDEATDMGLSRNGVRTDIHDMQQCQKWESRSLEHFNGNEFENETPYNSPPRHAGDDQISRRNSRDDASEDHLYSPTEADVSGGTSVSDNSSQSVEYIIEQATQTPDDDRLTVLKNVRSEIFSAHVNTCLYTSERIAEGLEKYSKIMNERSLSFFSSFLSTKVL